MHKLLSQYLLQFLIYLVSGNGMPLKLGLGVTQSHRKWRCSIDHIRDPIDVPQ